LLLVDSETTIRPMSLLTKVTPRQQIESGSQVELECFVEKLPLGAELTWVKRGEFLATYSIEDGLIEYEEDIYKADWKKEDHRWSLILHKVTSHMAGIYECQIIKNEAVISSVDIPVIVEDPGLVEHRTQYLISKHGRNITLDCSDFDDEQEEEEEVTWRKRGGTSVVDGSKLSLIRVDRSDSGIYICSVSGSTGSRTLNISLLVEHIPMVEASSVLVSQAPGYPATLSCQVAGVPVPLVAWHKLGQGSENQTVVHSHGDTDLVIEDYKDGLLTTSLEFGKISYEDYGDYSCNASNSLGEASVTIRLQYSPIPILQSSGDVVFHSSPSLNFAHIMLTGFWLSRKLS